MPRGRTPRPASAEKLGRRLARVVRNARYRLDPAPSAATIASKARISVDALRKIERGDIADPGFFTIARVCRALDVPLEDVEVAALGKRR